MEQFFTKLAIILATSTTLALGVTPGIHASMFDGDGDADFRKIHLISPVGGDTLLAGTTQRINWQVSNVIDYLTIEYSTNNGEDWVEIVRSLKVDYPADYYRWQVPCTLSDEAKVKLTDAYGPDYDTSLKPFSIVDRTAPSLKLSLAKQSLWPTNGEMEDVGFSFAAEDNCDPNPQIFLKITSDEPITGGRGSDIEADAKIAAGNNILLRAERSEEGNGRVYVISVTATDSSGNSSSASATVKVNVTKDQEAIDSGQFYDATSKN